MEGRPVKEILYILYITDAFMWRGGHLEAASHHYGDLRPAK